MKTDWLHLRDDVTVWIWQNPTWEVAFLSYSCKKRQWQDKCIKLAVEDENNSNVQDTTQDHTQMPTPRTNLKYDQ